MKGPIYILMALASLCSLAAAQDKKPAPKPVSFAPATSVPGIIQETSIASGDLTNNGVQDLVITSVYGGFFTALGNGDGTFQPFAIQGAATIQNSIVVATSTRMANGISSFRTACKLPLTFPG